MIPSQPHKEPEFEHEVLERNDKNQVVFRRFYLKGDANNMFYMRDNGPTISVSLKLSAEQRRRDIGQITKSTRTMFMTRERAKHLFHKLGSAYGFCYHILRYQTTFDFVSLSDEQQNWKIPVKFILDNGTIKEFKNNGGFEIQIFIRLDQLTQYEIKKEEGRRI